MQAQTAYYFKMVSRVGSVGAQESSHIPTQVSPPVGGPVSEAGPRTFPDAVSDAMSLFSWLSAVPGLLS